MYHGSGDARSAQPSRETFAGFDPEATARTVLARLRKLHDAYAPGMPLERTPPPDFLASAMSDPILERERLFMAGWLHWLNEEPAVGEPLLAEAMRLCREQNARDALAESAYWCGRMRLLLGRPEALTEFESVLRTLGGSPRATAWFVDLLGRAGCIDRAEQVWKSVRGNRRVLGCVEGPLLEARMLLRRGEWTPAERVLAEEIPTNGVVWVERLLLLAWITASQTQADKAREMLRQAREGPYPLAALRNWTTKIEQRLGGEAAAEERVPPALADYLRGQQLRREGRKEEASAGYRSALHSPPAQPFARYGLACLEQEDAAALLASQPGLFLAVRCRMRLTLQRFCRREATAAEFLETLRQAEFSGYEDAAVEPFRRLALALQAPSVDANGVRALAANACADAAGRNAFRVALELAIRRLSDAEGRELLGEWMKRADVTEELRSQVERQLLRLQPAELLRFILNEGNSSAARLWVAAQRLDPSAVDSESWREEVRQLHSLPRWKGLAQALLVQEAAQRGEVETVVALLDDVDAWRGLRTPPRFVLRAVERVLAAQPHHPAWGRGLARWLQLWDLTSIATKLKMHARMTPRSGDTAEPPDGVAPAPWFLYQAARALGRDDALEALAFTRRALAVDPDLASVPDAEAVRAALPQLQRRARAQALAGAGQSAGTLMDVVDALAETADGAAVLDALDAGDVPLARLRLETLSERPDLSPRLAHHLALLMQRAARSQEEGDDSANAVNDWRRAWRCWMRFLAASEEDKRRILFDYLLEQHRHRINDLLARNCVDAARRYAQLVRALPALAQEIAGTLRDDLAGRIERFREELATDYLLTTREAMRFGVVPEGWRADYEKGLTYLRRLLSLERDDARLLAALVEICNDWFLDLYHQRDAALLRTQLERFTPFALQLARRIDERPGDLPARAALSDFWKFRGFLVADAEQKAALYREALRFNPANTNVRDLLDECNSEREKS
jgi:hypothetical protein